MAIVVETFPLSLQLVPSVTTRFPENPLRGRLVIHGRFDTAVLIAANTSMLTALWTLPVNYSYVFESLNAAIAGAVGLGINDWTSTSALELTNSRIESVSGDVEFYPFEVASARVGATGIQSSMWSAQAGPVGLLRPGPDLTTTCLWSTANDSGGAREQPINHCFFRASFLLFDVDLSEQFPLGGPIPLVAQ